MYRIELAPGEEALFKSIDEMAAGIANGVISSQARIWHQTSNKWLPIEFHPHYKIALTKGPQTAPKADYLEAPAVAGPAAMAAPAPAFEKPVRRTEAPAVPKPIFDLPAAKPLFERPAAAAPTPYAAPAPKAAADAPPMLLQNEMLSVMDAVMLAPEPPRDRLIDRQPAPMMEPAAEPDSFETAGSIDYLEIHPSRGRGRTWTVGLVAAAAVVLLGGGAAFSAFRSRSGAAQPRTAAGSPASYGARSGIPANTSTPSFGSNDSRSTDDVALPAPKAAEKDVPKITDAPHIVDAPRVSVASLGLSDADRPASDRPSGMTPSVLVAHYSAAYEAARADLDRGMRLAGLGSIFAASRLSAGQVANARTTVAGAANLVRIYRRRSAAIEQTYRDSVSLLTRQIGWSPAQIAVWENRPTQLESSESAALANSLLDTMDGVLGSLSAHEGGYDLNGGSVVFRDAAAAREYGAARRRLAGLADGGADSGTPAGRILRALAGAQPPEEQTGS